ncbi:MAG TPA: hypothetical protein VFA65_24060 [Bryobacteraceae bacterium]|nr:hypothetical protein [Bryobacteraceae bacterium]
MDGDRKYRQHGYQDSDRGGNSYRSDRPRPAGPKLPLDVTGPKLPRLVQTVAAARCYNCSVALAPDTDFTSKCPKCGSALHCCKQCVNFDSSTRFQCLKPIPVRIAAKDQANSCELFSPRVTVARDSAPAGSISQVPGNGTVIATPRNANDARAAFDSLFKK